MIYRQQERRELFVLNFERMKFNQTHSHRPNLGFGGPRVETHENRHQRRNRARSFATGAWRKLVQENKTK